MFINENNINIDLGLKQKYKIIQFSDTHLTLYDETDDEEAINYVKQMEEAWYKVRVDFAHHFNEKYDHNLLPSKECFDKLIEYVNTENPDCLLLTGDIIDYYSPTNYRYLEKSLASLKCKYLFCCGNHEMPLESFETICKDEIEAYEFEEIIVVSLDNSKKEFSAKQLAILKKLLEKNKPIILGMHIPIITNYNEDMMKMYDEYFAIRYNNSNDVTKEFINLLISNENVKAILCGHTHGKSVSNFGSNKPQYIASSGLIGFVNKITIT